MLIDVWLSSVKFSRCFNFFLWLSNLTSNITLTWLQDKYRVSKNTDFVYVLFVVFRRSFYFSLNCAFLENFSKQNGQTRAQNGFCMIKRWSKSQPQSPTIAPVCQFFTRKILHFLSFYYIYTKTIKNYRT